MKRTLKRGLKDLKPLGRKLWGLAIEKYVLRNWSLKLSLPELIVETSKNLYFQKARWIFWMLDISIFWYINSTFGGLRDLCDLVVKASIDPSWNTDQGVKQLSKFASEKLISVMKVSSRCQTLRWQHRPSLIFYDGYEQELNCLDPKDGELCMSRVKSGETLMEARSGTDVQIVRETCV
jgi:hypothetical protein